MLQNLPKQRKRRIRPQKAMTAINKRKRRIRPQKAMKCLNCQIIWDGESINKNLIEIFLIKIPTNLKY